MMQSKFIKFIIVWCNIKGVCVLGEGGGGVEDIFKKKYEIIQSFRVFQVLLVYIKVNIVCDQMIQSFIVIVLC